MQNNPIFLLEDDLEMSRMYERAFHLAGHEVVLARDGAEAVKMLNEVPATPKAIILDIMVPKINGLELLHGLRDDPRFKETPIAVLTNSFYKDDADRFLAAGADIYLVKIEHQIKEVVEKIEMLIKTRHADAVKV
jgi:DNA-binding response OmpR family regulator